MITEALLWSALALLAGGVVKGATGAGVPVVAVPVIGMAYDVQTAVAVMMMPNLLSNLVQGWQYRTALPDRRLLVPLLSGAALGTVFGTVLLTLASVGLLAGLVAGAVFIYVALRLARPNFQLHEAPARGLALPVGLIAGGLQGATGISAPISLSYLNAMQLNRATFVASASILFVAMSVTQIPALMLAGILNGARLIAGLGAFGLVMAAMPLGAWVGKRLSARLFDRLILTFLCILALRLSWVAVQDLAGG